VTSISSTGEVVISFSEAMIFDFDVGSNSSLSMKTSSDDPLTYYVADISNESKLNI